MADRHAAKDAMQQLWISHEVYRAAEADAFAQAASSGAPAMRLMILKKVIALIMGEMQKVPRRDLRRCGKQGQDSGRRRRPRA